MNKIKDYIYKDITSVQEDTHLEEVIQMMLRHRLSVVPVVNKVGDFLGCISDQDILNAGVPDYVKLMRNTAFMAEINKTLKHLKNILQKPASNYMDTKCPTVKPNNTVSFTAELMFRNKREVLPVLDGKKLVGSVSQIDILAVAIEKNNPPEEQPC